MFKTTFVSATLAFSTLVAGLIASLILWSSLSIAEVPSAVANTIISKLSSGRSDLTYQVTGPAPMAGFYEVQVDGGPLLYVSASGEYFFDGSLYQVSSGQFVNVRDMRLNDERKTLFATRSTSDMIIFKPSGQTKAVMNVFTDVDCGYCRK